ncbi:MAG: DUF1360 domain-containing protein [Bryobacteraceae bacterium]
MTTKQNESRVVAGYDGKELPLAGYAALVGIYTAGFAAFLFAAKSRRRDLPERIGLGDLLLFGVGTFKLSRIIAKDRVTSPFRAPFTTYEGPGDTNELKEKSRGEGMQRALGDLLTCPWCMGPWAAAALAYGFVLAPRPARLAAGILSATAISDALHLGHDALVKETK